MRVWIFDRNKSKWIFNDVSSLFTDRNKKKDIFMKKSFFLFLLAAGVNVLNPPNPVADVVGTPNPVAGFCWLNNPPVGAAAFAPKLPNDEPMAYKFIFNKAIQWDQFFESFN